MKEQEKPKTFDTFVKEEKPPREFDTFAKAEAEKKKEQKG